MHAIIKLVKKLALVQLALKNPLWLIFQVFKNPISGTDRSLIHRQFMPPLKKNSIVITQEIYVFTWFTIV